MARGGSGVVVPLAGKRRGSESVALRSELASADPTSTVSETDGRMGDGQLYETEWDGLRIVIEEHPRHFQIFIYDPGKCEVLYTAERMSLDAAKFAAVDFVATARFGPTHGLKLEIVAAMLVWENR